MMNVVFIKLMPFKVLYGSGILIRDELSPFASEFVLTEFYIILVAPLLIIDLEIKIILKSFN